MHAGWMNEWTSTEHKPSGFFVYEDQASWHTSRPINKQQAAGNKTKKQRKTYGDVQNRTSRRSTSRKKTESKNESSLLFCFCVECTTPSCMHTWHNPTTTHILWVINPICRLAISGILNETRWLHCWNEVLQQTPCAYRHTIDRDLKTVVCIYRLKNKQRWKHGEIR